MTKVVFIQYPPCSTCQKAQKWLDDHYVPYESRHIVEQPPSYAELKSWQSVSQLPLKRFFNTSGLVYRKLELKDKLTTMSEDEQLKLLASNGMLVKRPIVIYDSRVLIGFKPKEWKTLL